MKKKRKDKGFEIWIKTEDFLVRFIPKEANIERKFIGDWVEQVKINWIEDKKQVFDSNLIDKRCKNPSKILEKLVKKYGV